MRAAVLLAIAALLVAGCAVPELPRGLGGGGATTTTTTTPPTATTPPPDPSGILAVHYVDVGQGDGVIWQFPDGTFVAYDCGESVGQGAFSPMVAQLQALGATRLHALVVSHGHADHAGGCADVLDAFEVAHVYDGWYLGDDRTLTYAGFQARALAEEGATLHTLRDVPQRADDVRIGGEVDLPASTGARARVLFPAAPTARSWDDVAEESLVVRLEYGEVAFCHQGDIATREEATLAAMPGDLSCDAYLVGHHGSREASSAAWLARMKPRAAVASFGENDYGHPTAEALCRIQEAGATVWTTHESGTVTLTSNGRTLGTPEGAEARGFCAPNASYWNEDPVFTTQALRVDATASDAQPCRYADVTIEVVVADPDGQPAPGANVTATWRYKSSAPTMTNVTGAAGTAAFTRSIGSASAGYEVVVDVRATLGEMSGRATASFTPRAC